MALADDRGDFVVFIADDRGQAGVHNGRTHHHNMNCRELTAHGWQL